MKTLATGLGPEPARAHTQAAVDSGGQTYADDAGWRTSQTKAERFHVSDLDEFFRGGAFLGRARESLFRSLVVAGLDVAVHIGFSLAHISLVPPNAPIFSIRELTIEAVIAAACVFVKSQFVDRLKPIRRFILEIVTDVFSTKNRAGNGVRLDCLNRSFGSGQVQFCCGTRGFMASGHLWTTFIRWKQSMKLSSNPGRRHSLPKTFVLHQSKRTRGARRPANEAGQGMEREFWVLEELDNAFPVGVAPPMSASGIATVVGSLFPSTRHRKPKRIRVVLSRYVESSEREEDNAEASEEIVIPMKYFYDGQLDGWREFVADLATHKMRSEGRIT